MASYPKPSEGPLLTQNTESWTWENESLAIRRDKSFCPDAGDPLESTPAALRNASLHSNARCVYSSAHIHISATPIISSQLTREFCTKCTMYPPRGAPPPAQLRIGPRLHLPVQDDFRVAEHLSASAFPATCALQVSGFVLGENSDRSHVRERRLRHQRGHPDPLRHGGGEAGQRHRGADQSAQLPVHGRQSHLVRRAQSRDRAPVSNGPLFGGRREGGSGVG